MAPPISLAPCPKPTRPNRLRRVVWDASLQSRPASAAEQLDGLPECSLIGTSNGNSASRPRRRDVDFRPRWRVLAPLRRLIGGQSTAARHEYFRHQFSQRSQWHRRSQCPDNGRCSRAYGQLAIGWKAQCDILALKLMTRSQSLNRSTCDPFREHHRRGGVASPSWLR
jgi:hypothetical protein